MASPLTADALLRTLRAEGLTVHEVRSWRIHNRNSKGAWGPVNGVMLHHTASGTSGIVNYCYDGTSDLPGPLCHGAIDKNGDVWLVGNGRANHAGGGDPQVLAAVVAESFLTTPPKTTEHQGSTGAVDGNPHFYGFECVNKGDGKDPWPDAQVEAMVKASAALCRAHGWSAKSTIGHLEWSDWKSDPKGIAVAMPSMRSKVASCLALKAGQWKLHPAPTPTPTPSPTPAPSNGGTTVASTQDMVDNYMAIKSLVENNPDGTPEVHGGGYYLAHTEQRIAAIQQQLNDFSNVLADLTAAVDSLKTSA